MPVAEVSIVPIGTKTASLSKYIAAAFKIINSYKQLKVQLSPMATIIEANTVEAIFEAVIKAREEIFKMGINRVLTQIKIDERRDKPISIKSKIDSVEKKL